ncbi:GIY-YIG nuclease family protein [Vibrio aquaticus]|uniref:GIY-YIG nuclease family protein n=1 Tax=Vibrio aquaticus TaxID=2496559 RepID=A0A432D0J7_9VIBR|nr:GIY-YIG nuclease family protein [Vibrio aquaticus]RTZ17398.1 GIY-YIG nuclease family protein [Vibrio aquaticus]
MEKNPSPKTDWFVYLIRMPNNALYCGITTDVERRFNQHSTGKGAKALRGKAPLTLVWSHGAGHSRSTASKIEYQVKQLKKAQKERLIGGVASLAQSIDLTNIE